MRKCSPKILWALFIVFFKAGTFTFAGGLAMLPIIERDLVEKYRLIKKEEFLEYATLSQTLPGVIAANCACFVGRYVAGTPGMLAACLGATISAFILMLAATIAVQYIPQNGPVMGAMSCIRAASSALILSAAFKACACNAIRCASSKAAVIFSVNPIICLSFSAITISF